MENLKVLQKNEALIRMKMLHLHKNVIDDFVKNGRVYYSERQSKYFDGILYYIDNNNNYVDIVKNFEKDNNALVYHAQLTHLTFGDCLSLLYVSKDTTEWDMDKDDLKNKCALVYVKNLTDDFCSEFGTIGIESKNGGVSRTY